MPGVIGCIDCTHVAIVAPPVNDEHHPERIYINRKNYHSLNVQLVSKMYYYILGNLYKNINGLQAKQITSVLSKILTKMIQKRYPYF